MVKNIKILGREGEQEDELIIKILKKRYQIVISDSPDYIISYNEFPDYIQYPGVRIHVIGENIRPDFNLCDYAIGFDHINFDDRYIRWPLYARYENDFTRALKKNEISTGEKQKFCNFIVSNNRADAYREQFFLLLNQYKKIDSGGRFLNNIGGPVDNKRKFQEQYKFSLAFENSSTKGYVTEKIIQAWAAGTIPIYWGDPLINKEFNPKAFINCKDFDSDEEVIAYIKKIDNDAELFQKILREPIIAEGCFGERYTTNKILEDFLYHIFEQPIETAFRRNDTISKGYGFWHMHEKYTLEYINQRQSKLVRAAYKISQLGRKSK